MATFSENSKELIYGFICSYIDHNYTLIIDNNININLQFYIQFNKQKIIVNKLAKDNNRILDEKKNVQFFLKRIKTG